MTVISQAAAEKTMAIMVRDHDPAVHFVGKNNPNTNAKEAYARLSFDYAGNEQASLAGVAGQRKFRTTGTLLIECFYPHGEPGSAMEFAEGYRDIFEGKEADGIWFRDVSIIRNNDRASAWFRLDVVATFEYDRLK